MKKFKMGGWGVGMVIITAVAMFFRFFDYENRWVLNQDQARDAIIALYALRNNLMPEIGSPSSAGPFNFGPWYFWIIMLFTKLSFGRMMGPWVGFTLLSVTTVWAYALVGKKLGGKKMGLITGLLAALACGQVENAPDMLNTVIVGWSSGWGMLLLVKMIEDKKWLWGIGGGLMIGLAMNFHFQALGLGSLLIMSALVNNFKVKEKMVALMGMSLGWLGAFSPLLIFDLAHQGVWIKSVIWYYTVGVKKFWVPVRWLWEIRDFWPQLFGKVLTNTGWVGYGVVVIAVLALYVSRKEIKKIPKSFLMIVGSLLIQVVLMRYYRGVRSREYLIAFHGYIIVLTGWAVGVIYQKKQWLGAIILAVILFLARRENMKIIYTQPSQAKTILAMKDQLDKEIKGDVTIEQYQESDMVALPIFYLYYRENRIGEGERLSFCDRSRYECLEGEFYKANNYRVYRGRSEEGWSQLTAKNIYERLMVNYGNK